MDVVFYDERLLGQALPTSEELISYCARESSGQTSPPGTRYAVLSTGYSCEDHPFSFPPALALLPLPLSTRRQLRFPEQLRQVDRPWRQPLWKVDHQQR